jgi:secreted protein with Ig-like and vWFA domain
MNSDEPNNLQPWSDPELEARVVALVLGEASDFEREDLERLLAEEPELRLFKERIEEVHRMLGEQDGAREWKLSDARRQKVLAVATSKSKSTTPWWAHPGLRIAAAVVILAAFAVGLGTYHLGGVGSLGDGAQIANVEAPQLDLEAMSTGVVGDGQPDGFGLGARAPRSSTSGDAREEGMELTKSGAGSLDLSSGSTSLGGGFALGSPPKEMAERDPFGDRDERPARASATAASAAGPAPAPALPEPALSEVAAAKPKARDGLADLSKTLAMAPASPPPPPPAAPGKKAEAEASEFKNQGSTRKMAIAESQVGGKARRAVPISPSPMIGDAFAPAAPEPAQPLSQAGGERSLSEENSPQVESPEAIEAMSKLFGRSHSSSAEAAENRAVPASPMPSLGAAIVRADKAKEAPVDVDRYLKLRRRIAPSPRNEGGKQQPAKDLATDKLESTIIPEIEFEETPFVDAIEFLRQKSRELDPDPDPTRRGVGVEIRRDSAPPSPSSAGALGFDDPAAAAGPGLGNDLPNINLKLTNVSVAEALRYVTELGRVKYKVENNQVVVMPLMDGNADLFTQTFQAPPGFLAGLPPVTSPPSADAFTKLGTHAAPPIRTDAERILESVGVTLPPDSEASYNSATGELTVRNTQANLDLVKAYLDSIKPVAPPETSLESSTANEPFSTFSLHVSDVSFQLAQTALAKNEWPDQESVRIEEFVNAFDYGDPSPGEAEPVSCQIEQAAHPFAQQRNLLRFGIRTASVGRGASTPLRLTVLLDSSGSMERPDRHATVQRAFERLAGELRDGDEITLITFARQPRLVAERANREAAANLSNQIASMPSEGGTNLEAALVLAAEKALANRTPGAQNRIVLLTDGAANLGNANADRLAAMIDGLRQDGIAFDAAGIGADGLNDTILEALTRKGDGRYYLLNRPEDADEGFARKLAGAFRPGAKDVKVQIQFNPDRVGRYRLLGFEEHRLNKEDFRDDTVDAAELASEEAGVATYQVEVNPEGSGDVGFVSVRFLDVASGERVERRWLIPYEPGVSAFDQASPSLRLAGLASWTAAKLKDDGAAAGTDWAALNRMHAALPETWKSLGRIRDLGQMLRTAEDLGQSR